MYRKANNFTQDILGKLIGTDRSTIASYENGRRNISYIRAKQFAQIFHIKPEDILNNDYVKENTYSFYVKNIDKKTYETFVMIYNNLKCNKN